MASRPIDVIGVPYDYGQPKGGVENGPPKMREAFVVEELKKSGLIVHDTGDLEFEQFADDPTVSNVKRPRAVGRANKKINDAMAKSLSDGHACLLLGGDHSMAIGSIHGHAAVEPNLGVIWVDAHCDINPPLKSETGNVHGMPLAFLAHELRNEIPDDIPEFDWIKPCLHLKDIAYIAIRDVDEAEKVILKEHHMAAYWADDVTKLGIEEVVRRCIEHVSPNGSRPIHLSFDIDGLDPKFAPSTGTAVPGGLTLEQGVYIVETVAKTGKLSVLDLAEVNPKLGSSDDQKQTLESANKVVAGWGAGVADVRRGVRPIG